MSATPEQIRATVEKYVDLVATGPSTEIVKLYADGATVEDPVGTEVLTTPEQILGFYSNLDGLKQHTRLLAVRIAGNEAAFHFEVITDAGEMKVNLSPMDVMTFDDEGKITSMRAFWSKDDLVFS